MGTRDYVVYEEIAVWPWWVATIVLVAVAGGVAAGATDVLRGLGGAEPGLLWRGVSVAGASVLLGSVFWGVFGRLRVLVTRTSVLVSYGYTGLIQKLVDFGEIESVEPVRYSPLREFGGWGIRFGGSRKRAWTIRGDGAVVLALDDGTLFYVGSDRPGRLAEQIRTAMGRARRRETEAP